MKKTIEDIDVAGKRVLMRVDFNVPLHEGEIADDRRIQMSLPSIKSVLDRGGFVTLMSHLDRPSGTGFEEKYSLAPVATRLSKLLNQPVSFSDTDDSSPLILRENLRFHAEEKSGNETFAKQLSQSADIYCNDAFGTAHRSHTSMIAVPKVMEGKPRVAGLLLAKELQYLGQAIENAEHPFVAILGGAKVSDKLGVIEHLLGKVDTILIGGAMAYTFLVARGEQVGNSFVERDRVQDAEEILAVAKASTTEILLPTDHVCAKQIVQGTPVQVVSGSIQDGWKGVDIGPETICAFTHCLLQAKTIVWNGPMGVFETEPFDVGTKEIAKTIALATKGGAVSIVGGGDSAAAVSAFGLDDQMTHISTGGGASLQMLEGIEFSSVALLDDAV